jgi:UDPglucose 6-dehydrogenase
MRLVETTIDINAKRKLAMAERIIAANGGSVEGKIIAVLGVTFKPNTDDMRDAPSLDIIPALQKAGATIRAFDPAGMKEADSHFQKIEWCEDPYVTVDGADCVAILTEWNEFRSMQLEKLAWSMKRPLMVDLRNIYDPAEMARQGFIYHSIGRRSQE